MPRPTVPSTLALLAILGSAGCSELPTPPSETQPTLLILPGVPPTFTAVDLGTLPGFTKSVANDIRLDSRIAVGTSYNTAPLVDGRPTAWSFGTGVPVMHDLGLPPNAIWADARAINASGTVVGAYKDGTTNQIVPFSWTQGGGYVTLPLPAGAVAAQANDLNDTGTIVGWYQDASVGIHAFSYTAAGGYVDLHPAGFIASHANGVNDNGEIVGDVTTLPPALEKHAATWDAAGTFTDLGGLGSPALGFAWDINDRGNLVGTMGVIPPGTGIQAFAVPFGSGGIATFQNMAEGRGISARNRLVGSAAPPNFNAATRLGVNGTTDLLPMPAGAIQGLALKASRCGHIVGYSNYGLGILRATAWQISSCD